MLTSEVSENWTDGMMFSDDTHFNEFSKRFTMTIDIPKLKLRDYLFFM